MLDKLIFQLEHLTHMKVSLTESEIPKQFKKKFYGVSADFDKDLGRLMNFYEVNVGHYPELKPLLRRAKKLKVAFEELFANTEALLDDKEDLNETQDDTINVGDYIQVYNKGEAYIGGLVDKGVVRSLAEDSICFDEQCEYPKFYSPDTYDFVKINIKQKVRETFEDIYKRSTSLQPIPSPLQEIEGQTDQPEQPATPEKPVEPTPVEPTPVEPTMKTAPKEFGQVAQETKNYIDTIVLYTQPQTGEVTKEKDRIYKEFVDILKRYHTELPLDTSTTSVEVLTELNSELKSFIDIYEIPI